MQEKKLQKAKKKLKKLKLQLANPSLGKVDVKPHLGLKESSYLPHTIFKYLSGSLQTGLSTWMYLNRS